MICFEAGSRSSALIRSSTWRARQDSLFGLILLRPPEVRVVSWISCRPPPMALSIARAARGYRRVCRRQFRFGSERSLRLGSRELEDARDSVPAIGRDGSELRVYSESGLAGRRCAMLRRVAELPNSSEISRNTPRVIVEARRSARRAKRIRVAQPGAARPSSTRKRTWTWPCCAV